MGSQGARNIDSGALPSILSRLRLKRSFRSYGGVFRLPRGPGYDLHSWSLRHQQYELDEILAASGVQNPHLPTLEFGAGAGITSCVLSSLKAPGVPYHAYEPVPAVAAIAEWNRERNHCDFVLHREALHATESTVELDGRHWMGRQAKPASTGVTARSLQDLLPEHGPVDLVLDVEGAEADALEAALPELQQYAASVSIELHPQVYGRDGTSRVLQFLTKEAGFELVSAGGEVYAFRNPRIKAPGRPESGVQSRRAD